MNNEEIFEYMRNNKINILFKDPKNQEKFIEYLMEYQKTHINTLFLGKEVFCHARHITYFYDELNNDTPKKTLLHGSDKTKFKPDIFYEDLMGKMTVELI